MAATKEIITEICPIFPRYGLNMISIVWGTKPMFSPPK
jgi:hypothetical protein